MEQGDVCEYCGKQPLFMCAECKWTAYCSKQHQLQHWRVHREHCNIINSYRLRKEEEAVNKTRSQLRKKYLEHFMHKIYDSCIKIALQMVHLEQKHIKTTRQIFNEMEYGISVCLLARSWLNVRNDAKAMIVIQSYLEEKMHFLKDMRDIISFETLHKHEKKTSFSQPDETEILVKNRNQLSRSRKSSQKLMQVPLDVKDSSENHSKLQISSNLTSSHLIIKQFAIKKVSLIASVANILYTIKQPVLKMYEIYTQHIEKMFGRESHETSNCYFMMGSHFMEKHEYNKSIACFMRASELRGNIAGDCYYNLGIIYHLLRKPQVALMMFQNAAKLRENQFSQNSSEVADVYHNLALINQSLGDFKSAIQNLQKIALIYSKDKNSQQYKNAKESIKMLEGAFRKHMEKTANLSPMMINDLKKTIRLATGKMQQDAISEHSLMSERDGDKSDKFTGSNNYLKISDPLLNKMNRLEAFYLSELQIELTRCESIYMAATTVGSSPFLRVLKLSVLEELIKDNQALFKNVSIEKLSKRGMKDNPQLD